jgi:hypothetical protein
MWTLVSIRDQKKSPCLWACTQQSVGRITHDNIRSSKNVENLSMTSSTNEWSTITWDDSNIRYSALEDVLQLGSLIPKDSLCLDLPPGFFLTIPFLSLVFFFASFKTFFPHRRFLFRLEETRWKHEFGSHFTQGATNSPVNFQWQSLGSSYKKDTCTVL